MNCWEFKQCGRDKDGMEAILFGSCPAYPNWGTSCARIAGTLNGTEPCGKCVKEIPNCSHCDFYNSEHYMKGSIKPIISVP